MRLIYIFVIALSLYLDGACADTYKYCRSHADDKVYADLTGDGKDDYYWLCQEDDHTIKLHLSDKDNKNSAQVLTFGIGQGDNQASLCAEYMSMVDLEVKPASLPVDQWCDPGDTSNYCQDLHKINKFFFKAKSEMLVLSDGMCDSFHIYYFDGHYNWWRH